MIAASENDFSSFAHRPGKTETKTLTLEMYRNSIPERNAPRNPNYTRYYEFSPTDSQTCQECPSFTGGGHWCSVLKRVRGTPVHTNWPLQENDPISKVYICESPSNREFSHGLPSIGTTGQKIFKKEFAKSTIETHWLDQLDAAFYRTNLIRCQADASLQKGVDTEIKIQRIEEAAPFCIRHLECEIRKICQQPFENSIEFTIAVGRGFRHWNSQIDRVIQNHCQANDKAFRIHHRNHPTA